MPTPEELERMAKDLGEHGPGHEPAAAEASKLIEKVATQIRHRNDELVAGRIVHAVLYDHNLARQRCVAAIITDPSPRHPELTAEGDGAVVELLLFFPTQLASQGINRQWVWSRGDAGDPGTWHFSIACPFAKKETA